MTPLWHNRRINARSIRNIVKSSYRRYLSQSAKDPKLAEDNLCSRLYDKNYNRCARCRIAKRLFRLKKYPKLIKRKEYYKIKLW